MGSRTTLYLGCKRDISYARRATMYMANIIVWMLGVHFYLMTHQVEAQTCEAAQTTCNDGSRCIPSQWICDGEEDCVDGSDEDDCARCQSSRWLCADESQCLLHSWRCDGQADCRDGSDEDSCASDVIVLIVDVNGPIYKINNSDGTSSIVYRDEAGAENVAYDRVLKEVYWSNLWTHRIQKVNLDGQGHTRLADVNRCQGMVVDDSSRLLFYSDDTTKLIHKLDLQSMHSTHIVTTSYGNRPHHLTVDVRNRILYWTELGNIPGIMMSDYYGNNRERLLQTGRLPTTLVLDSSGSTLFWCNEGSVDNVLMALDVASKSTRTVPYGRQGNLFDLDILDTTLYIIDRYQMSAYLTLPEIGGTSKVHSAPKGMNEYRHIKAIAFP